MGVNPRTGEKVQINGRQRPEVLGRLAAEEGRQLARSALSARNVLLKNVRRVAAAALRCVLSRHFKVRERMFVYREVPCSSPSTPPIGSSSSSRPAAGRCPPRRRRGRSSPSRARRRRSPGRCSTTSSPVTRVSPGAARSVGLAAPPGADVLLEHAHFVVVDLETTGLSPRTSRICEIGAQRVRALELEDAFETLVDPGVPLPPAIASLTGIEPRALRGAPRAELAVRQLARVRRGRRARRAQRALRPRLPRPSRSTRLTGRRIAAPVVDTVWLARRLLGERTRRVGLAALAHFFGVSTEPCHRALPDARATAEILLVLIGLAQERGARTRRRSRRACGAARPAAPRQALARRGRADDARASTCSAGRRDMALYVGRARELRARLRSYFAGGRQRPAVEAALGALERVEWRETGSELEAALEELRLLRELRPPGQRARHAARPARLPPASRQPLERHDRADARRAAHRRRARAARRPGARRSRLGRRRGRRRAPRGRDSAGSRVSSASRTPRGSATDSRRSRRSSPRSASSSELRSLRACVVVPAGGPGSSGRMRSRADASRRERLAPVRRGCVRRGRDAARRGARAVARSQAPEDVDELRLVASFLRRPPPELRVAALDARGDCRAGAGATLGRVTSEAAGGRHATVRGPRSPRPSSASDRSSSSGSTRSSTCCRSSFGARRAGGRAAAARAVERFCKGIVDAVAPYVVAVKPQVAFFEALGSDGWRALETVSRYAREAGLLVIADGKRGDIGSTARAYATAFLEPRDAEPPLADALTVSPYLGRDSLDPFLAACRRDGAGLFLLVRTSNAGAAELQDAILSDGRPVWRHVADLVDEWGEDLVGARGLSSVGAVVGATVPRIVGDARRAMPRAIILLPGVGAQGATPADVARAFTSGPCERARERLAIGDLRLPRRPGRGLARRRGRRGRAARERRLVGRRMVGVRPRRLLFGGVKRWGSSPRWLPPSGSWGRRTRPLPSCRRPRTSCRARSTAARSPRARPTPRGRWRASRSS